MIESTPESTSASENDNPKSQNRNPKSARSPWLVPAVLLALGVVIAAADRPAPRIGVVDADKIRSDSTFVRGRLVEISKPAEGFKLQLLAKRKEIQDAVDQFQAQATALSDEAKRAKLGAIAKLREEGDALSQSFNDALNKAQSQDVEFIRSHIMGIVAKLATERNMEVVVSTNNVLFSAPGTDLTATVVQRLDAGE